MKMVSQKVAKEMASRKAPDAGQRRRWTFYEAINEHSSLVTVFQ
jgi:hypothetical protein